MTIEDLINTIMEQEKHVVVLKRNIKTLKDGIIVLKIEEKKALKEVNLRDEARARELINDSKIQIRRLNAKIAHTNKEIRDLRKMLRKELRKR